MSDKEKVVAVSGGFDPIHIGHVRFFKAAKKLGDKLVVVLNNDHWLRKKKGYVFMTERDREEIISALEAVDRVIISSHPENPEDMSVCKELERLKPDVFANGGDRKKPGAFENGDIPEYTVCEKLGIEMKFNVGKGGKVRSSSQLIEDVVKKLSGKKQR